MSSSASTPGITMRNRQLQSIPGTLQHSGLKILGCTRVSWMVSLSWFRSPFIFGEFFCSIQRCDEVLEGPGCVGGGSQKRELRSMSHGQLQKIPGSSCTLQDSGRKILGCTRVGWMVSLRWFRAPFIFRKFFCSIQRCGEVLEVARSMN